MKTAIVWFRQDLRLSDNPALYQATQDCDAIIPVFIDETQGNSGLQAKSSQASHVWLHHSLQSLHSDLSRKGAQLIILQGEPLDRLNKLVQATQATHLYWNRRYDPNSIAVDTAIKEHFKETLSVHSFHANLLLEPWQLLNKTGKAYRVFTPFWKALQQSLLPQTPLPEPQQIHSPQLNISTLSIEDLGYLPTLPWANSMMEHWQHTAGENAAHHKLAEFIQNTVTAYKTQRDFPAKPATSKLSPHLHFGEISPRQIAYTANMVMENEPENNAGAEFFLREVVWREFAYYMLYHFPHMSDTSLDQRFHRFQWRTAEDYQDDLQRWQTGQTGFPLIDAGMRELWQTGWMHNRVRMITASFLIKNLLIPWQIGEQWFRDTLVDADVASNSFGWQWVAGCGADAAPYFRIFNPLLQSEKFDPDANYIRQWIPALKNTPNKAIHKATIDQANYPKPMIDLKRSRENALARFAEIKN